MSTNSELTPKDMTMARVEVKLFAGLREYIDGSHSVEVEIQAGQTIEGVLLGLGVPPKQTRIIFRNNRAATLSDGVEDGDRLGIFPAIGGG